jgi:2-amino-4-hydroxy-6-hydroxymethyldihydropteridine diphosphokinase
MSHQVQILLGSNLGDRKSYLDKAIEIIGETLGEITQVSRVFVTPAWGIENASDFYNQAITLLTDHSASELLKALLDIESLLGRLRTGQMTSRTIDLDIAFYDNRIIESEDLVIPHPRLHLRNFALAPLNDIAPRKNHPAIGKSVQELFEALPDHGEVTILPS